MLLKSSSSLAVLSTILLVLVCVRANNSENENDKLSHVLEDSQDTTGQIVEYPEWLKRALPRMGKRAYYDQQDDDDLLEAAAADSSNDDDLYEALNAAKRALPRMGRALPRMGRALPRMGRALPRMGRALPRMG